LLSLVALPVAYLESEVARSQSKTQHWDVFFARLEQHGRAEIVQLGERKAWVAAERLKDAALLWPESFAAEAVASEGDDGNSREEATTQLVQGWLQLLGPTTAARLAGIVSLHPRSINQALLKMEMQGLAMRGVFERPKPADDAPHEIEWCERRILHRIHRLT